MPCKRECMSDYLTGKLEGLAASEDLEVSMCRTLSPQIDNSSLASATAKPSNAPAAAQRAKHSIQHVPARRLQFESTPRAVLDKSLTPRQSASSPFRDLYGLAPEPPAPQAYER